MRLTGANRSTYSIWVFLVSVISCQLLSAQDVHVRAGVASAGYLGEIGYQYTDSDMLLLGVSYRAEDRRLLIDADTNAIPAVPFQSVTYADEFRELRLTAGWSRIIPLRRERWSLIYRAVVGYARVFEPSAEYEEALSSAGLRDDLFVVGQLDPGDQLLLGGSLGTRFGLNRRLYIEGLIDGLGSRRLTGSRSEWVGELGLGIVIGVRL